MHAAQGPSTPAPAPQGRIELLTDHVEWHVPGCNAIAGTYRGFDQGKAAAEARG